MASATTCPFLRELLRAFGRDGNDFDWVRDRAGYDRRYAIDSSKLRRLGWTPTHTDFSSCLADTIAWYKAHEDWWRPAKEAAEALYREREGGARGGCCG